MDVVPGEPPDEGLLRAGAGAGALGAGAVLTVATVSAPSATPDADVAPAAIRMTTVEPLGRALAGRNTTTVLPSANATEPATGLPDAVTVSAALVVAWLIASLKRAESVLFGAIPVAPSAGRTRTTRGAALVVIVSGSTTLAAPSLSTTPSMASS